MNLDLSVTSFSVRGAYLAICELPAGLFLKTLRGGTGNPLICRLVPLYDGQPTAYTCKASPSELVLSCDHGTIKICFAAAGILLFKGQGEKIGLRFEKTPDTSGFKYVHEVRYKEKIHHMMVVPQGRSRYIAHGMEGSAEVRQDWVFNDARVCTMDFLAENGGFFCALEEVFPEWEPKEYAFDFGQCVEAVQADFDAFYRSMPQVPEEFESVRELAAYVNWSAYVKKSGQFKRDAMLMSKNWMAGVWSWDHCFNAVALSYGNPKEAWDQFMLVFDLQDASGRLPDRITDTYSSNNFCKPPVHGWTLLKMAERVDLTVEQCAEAYDKLSRQTDWWLNCRDGDEDGICEYWHGNDSGWDNATAFRLLPPIESPDLAAYLVIQMEALAMLAVKLGLQSDAGEWREKSERMLENMVRHCYRDNKPVALQSGTHRESRNDSLLLYMPVILGKRLPEPILAHTLETLKSGRFLTEHGYATESPASPDYTPDGYWQGPIWAPPTMLIVDGLKQCGELELARDIARRFCGMVKKSGFAENFDAKTGRGLRDPAYTWTASVFLILANGLME